MEHLVNLALDNVKGKRAFTIASKQYSLFYSQGIRIKFKVVESTQPHSESHKLIEDLSFCVFDLETTGGNHQFDKIIEIGLVKIRNMQIIETMDFLLNPEIKIPEFIQKLTDITASDVENCPTIEEVIDDILKFMSDSILVAHNTSFDVPFFNSVLKRLDKPQLKNKSICTNLMTKNLIPNLMNSNLNYMSNIFGIGHQKAHRALEDAHATAQLLLNYLKIFVQKDISKVRHLYYPRNKYELDRINYNTNTPKEVILNKIGTLKTPSIVTLKGEHGTILYSLPCSNYREDLTVLERQLDQCPWELASIRLYGPFIEALINFRSLSGSLKPEINTDVMQYLWQQYFPNKKIPSVSNEKSQKLTTGGNLKGEFIIGHHLVPEQLIIIPRAALHQSHQMIFRYPRHQKKLIQYISSKSMRISRGRMMSYDYHPLLRTFIDVYIDEAKKIDCELFIFNDKKALSDPNMFIDSLEEFLEEYPNPYNYPREHL